MLIRVEEYLTESYKSAIKHLIETLELTGKLRISGVLKDGKGESTPLVIELSSVTDDMKVVLEELCKSDTFWFGE